MDNSLKLQLSNAADVKSFLDEIDFKIDLEIDFFKLQDLSTTGDQTI